MIVDFHVEFFDVNFLLWSLDALKYLDVSIGHPQSSCVASKDAGNDYFSERAV